MGDISEQEFGTVRLAPGTYTKIEMELTDVLTGGFSVLITGTYHDDTGGETSFSYSYANTEDFKFEDPEGVVISEGEEDTLELVFNVHDWFAAVDFASITPTEGVLIITGDDADSVEAAIEDAGEFFLVSEQMNDD